ncbi:MAG: hypothetical protein N3A38_02940 [Planctomycetota bacterium]|nr:hypothetical protein [Planctomycetota bacterium]
MRGKTISAIGLGIAGAMYFAAGASGGEGVRKILSFEPDEMKAYGKTGKLFEGKDPAVGFRAEPVPEGAGEFQLFNAANSRDWPGHVFRSAGATDRKFALAIRFDDAGRCVSRGGADFEGKGGDWSGFDFLLVDASSFEANAVLEMIVMDAAGVACRAAWFSLPKGKPVTAACRLGDLAKEAKADLAKTMCFKLVIGGVEGKTTVTVDNVRLATAAALKDAMGGREAAAERAGPKLTAEQEKLLAEMRAYKCRILFQSRPDTGGTSDWDIHIINADGIGRKNLTNTPGVHEVVPHASPDGTKVVFCAYTPKLVDGRRKTTSAICVMDIDGGNRRVVAENAQHPCWHPDGKRITYTKNATPDGGNIWGTKGIYSFNLETGREEKHTDELGGMNICWLADGRHVYSWNKYPGQGGAGNSGIWDTKENKKAAFWPSGCRADFAPDGRRVVYTPVDTIIDWVSYVTDPDGTIRAPKGGEGDGHQTVFVAANHNMGYCYFGDWSPESRYITFCAGNGSYETLGGGEWNIFVARDLPPTGKPAKDVEPVSVQITFDMKVANREPDWVPAPPEKR